MKFLIFLLATLNPQLDSLMEGNKRFASGKSQVVDYQEKRIETVKKQNPIAVIIGCSDSRVPPEIIFDQNLGDLFVVRVAGNIVDKVELDSIEFAIDQLKTPLVMVLGHQNCGAVLAVLNNKIVEEDSTHIAPFIEPAVAAVKNLPGDPLTNAIKENVRLVVKKLKANAIVSKASIVGAYYDLSTGKVEILEDNALK